MSEALHLFEGYGVELEYMIVDAETLNVAPMSDRVLHEIAGAYDAEVDMGPLCWSNELVAHVIELKTNGPAKELNSLTGLFQNDIHRINQMLAKHRARLMPASMHPWMDPHKETQLWSHEYNAVYESYNRIFNCKGHGWSNLQCTHMNLPFSGDDEFGRLHAAIRLILPALPALAASSPIADRQITQFADTRLNAYLSNSARIPSITAGVIPEAVFTHADYDREIFQRMYVDIAPFDTENILKHEWLNSRGAIARFDRGAIEIRLLDIQECPAADLAILSLITAVLKSLVSQQWLSFEEQKNFSVDELKSILLDAIRSGDQTPIGSDRYVAAFGIGFGVAATLGEFWQSLAGRVDGLCEQESLDVILNKGTLSRRIVGATGLAPTAEALKRVYGRLCDALAAGRMFDGAD